MRRSTILAFAPFSRRSSLSMLSPQVSPKGGLSSFVTSCAGATVAPAKSQPAATVSVSAVSRRRASRFLGGALDIQLAQLLEIDLHGRVRHQIYAAIVFRESNHVANVVRPRDQH